MLWLSGILIFFAGFGMIVTNSAINTMLQAIVEEGKRGRIMSLYVTFFSGLVPFGSLGSGSLASAIGAERTLFLGGMVCMISGIMYFFKQSQPLMLNSQNAK
jgi:MFS family permease